MGSLRRDNYSGSKKLREEFIYHILQWNPKWFTKGNESTVELKKILPLQIKPSLLSYDSFDDYYQTQLIFLLYDFWDHLKASSELRSNVYNIYKLFDDSEFKTLFSCRYIKVDSDNHQILYLKLRSSKSLSHIIIPNIGTLVKFKNPLKNNDEQFAFIQNVVQDHIHDRVTYEIAIKQMEKKKIPSTICLVSITLTSFYMTLIDSLINLPQTPLCQAILKPTIDDYEFSSVGDDEIISITEDTLSSKQLDIMARVVKTVEENKPKICMISGPAGTGKSKIIANCVFSMLSRKSTERILVCAQSNLATDFIAMELMGQKSKLERAGVRLNVIRLGQEEKMNEQVKSVSFASLKKKIRGQNPSILLRNANVICSTLASCSNNYIKHFFKDIPVSVCLIDEAPQAIEIETCNPLMLGVRILILVGDSQQFCPKVYSEEALDNNLGQSLFWRAQKIFEKEKKSPIMTLEDQYRMADAIAEWPNKFFYKGTLKNCVSVRPLGFYNYRVLNHSSPEEEGGYVNIGEAKLVVNIAYTVMTQAKLENLRSKIDIGIIAFSDLQRDLIIEMLDERTSDICDDRKDKFQLTVVKMGDAFQGSACDIIILSCVRSLEPKFIDDPNRLCVSLTRAKHTLIICGNFAEYNQNAMWDSLIKDAQKRNSYFTINYNDESSTLKQYQISDN
ncbi:probable helicase senataxin [Microplitis demolitor]|uniref:probable helicase senataxin n=1 Tax=Microplitis demolitor TaxID=69319 RepID=UPI0004CCCC4B|nr:probable helicase senataxin [Microplitis demolitor]XP_053594923.1 probable helicase senataxin [Microplitis demolitor]